jgi:hypothetical protein
MYTINKAWWHQSSSGTCNSWLALVRRIGFVTSRGWAQHIVDRWRDAVSNRPTSPHTTEIDLLAGEFFLAATTA